MSQMTASLNPTAERSGALRGMLTVPWWTVMSLAVAMAYADGFWMTSLRGAVGAIERTQGPFTHWLRESTLLLPVFVLAVLVALTLALRRFGPVLSQARTVVPTALLIAVAGTLVGVAAVAASSAYDYQLQSSQLQSMSTMASTGPVIGSRGSTGSMGSMGTSLAEQRQSTLGLQLRAVGYGAGMLLATNLVLVGWVVAIRGGRLDIRKTRP